MKASTRSSGAIEQLTVNKSVKITRSNKEKYSYSKKKRIHKYRLPVKLEEIDYLTDE